MAAKVNTRFVIILVGVLLALAVGVGGLAAYSLRMSGERNITAGDQLMAEAMQARSRGDEARALELISDAAGQYGRAVSKDTTRRDWLTVWRDTLLQTIPQTEVEYDKQLRERYVGALDRLAAIDPTNPEPQLAFVSFQDELFRAFGGPRALEWIAETASRRVLSLPEDSPTAIRIKGLRGLAISDQGDFQTIDHTLRQQAREDMERFYSAFKDDPEAFLAPLGSPDSEADAEQFAADAREHHARVARGLIRWHINERRVAESEGRTSDASNQLRAAVETSRRIMEDGFGYDRDVQFMVLDTQARALLEGDRVANPAEHQRAQARVIREGAERILPVVRSLEAEAIPLGQVVAILNWARQWEGRDELLAEIERAIGGTPNDAERLLIAAGAMRGLGSNDRALEFYDQIRALPRPTLSIEGLILPAHQRAAAYGQVEVNLGEYERARAAGRMDAANAYLEAAKAAREVLAAESGVAERGRVLRADSKLAIAQNDTRRAIRLLEEFRREYGDSSDVLSELATLLLREGTTGEAKQMLERLLPTNTITPDGVILLANIYRSEGNLDLALRTLETQARRSTTPQEFEDAIAQTRRLIAIEEGQESDDPIFAAAVRANEAIARRDFAQATSTLDRAVRANPEAARDVRFIMLRAQIAALTGDRDGAIEILERGLALLPGNPNLEQLRNRLASGDLVEARLAEIEQSDRPAIDKALARFSVLSSVGRQEEARAAMEQAEQIDRNHPAVLDYRFSIALSTADIEAAARIANRASEANADGVDGLLYQGRLQMARGNRAEAVRSLRTASTMIPSSVDIRLHLGRALLQSGQIDEGLTTLRRAHEARRDNLQVLGEYVQALRQLGRNQEARELLDPGNDVNAVARSN
ncbi:MAG: tetratricopeptide repeat protein, partial [Phycisphaerales bacterium]